MPVHERWWLPAPPHDDASVPLASPVLRAILQRRGIETPSDVRAFLEPAMSDLHDPSTIHGIAEATERILRAVRDKESILIYGDYDVDGVTSIVLLTTVLRSLGADAGHVVPHRLVDGYGLKIEVIERVLAERDVKLVITVDCGITSVEPVRLALDRGIDVIVTDHHLPPGTLPAAAAVLNPKQPGCTYPFKELAGVGVAFKLCCELIRATGKRISIESLVKIAAIGTIADVAPLVGENRTIARIGLDGLADPRNPGLRMLVRNLGLYGQPLRSVDVGFKIGPRINAAGRLASADTAIRLFAASSEEEAYPIVAELGRLNSERQQTEKEVLRSAEEQVAGLERLPNLLFLAGEGWHKGVLGLCAGRMMQKYHRPALAIRLEDGECVGSGRSISSIDLHGGLSSAASLFTHFGGHHHACGFSFPRSRLEAVRARLEETFEQLDAGQFVREIEVDGTLRLGEVNAAFVADHQRLEPFGAGNAQPVFLVRDAGVVSIRAINDEIHEIWIEDATGRGRLVSFASSSALLAELRQVSRADLLVRIEPDRRNVVTFGLVDVAEAGRQPIVQRREFRIQNSEFRIGE